MQSTTRAGRLFSFVRCPYCPRCPYRAGRVWYSLNAGRWCLCSVVHVVHIKAGGVEALASCCIKGAFCLKKPLFLLQKRPFLRKKPPFRAWIRPRGGGVSVFGCPRCPYRAASYVLRLWARFSCPRFAVFVPMRTAAVVVDCKRRRGRRTFRAFVLWCGCSFQYTAKPLHVGAFLSCVVHIVHVVHIWRRVWYSLNAAAPVLWFDPFGLLFRGGFST